MKQSIEATVETLRELSDGMKDAMVSQEPEFMINNDVIGAIEGAIRYLEKIPDIK